ncbi:MAG: hypothetical protein LBG97_09720 [Coriobacteriales bacterium]|jgi:L-amino acid N-acyltransferase YncA|nr:hypothetical protein [Coriobacteriales bacterium]
MSEKFTFTLFQESDAQEIANLLNRNRFYISEHAPVSPEDYLFVQAARGMAFSVVAKKGEKAIGMAAAYYTSGQKVANAQQIFLGTMLLDVRYRLSFAVLVGLYDSLIKEIVSRGFKDILAEVLPGNKQSLYVLLKYGFVLLSDETDIYGYWMLHNYLPAIVDFLGSGTSLASTKDFFYNLPLVNKKAASKSKPQIKNQYIECEYKLDGEKILLLIDTINLKVSGIDFCNNIKFYPDFEFNGKYRLEGNNKGALANVSIREIAAGGEIKKSTGHSLSFQEFAEIEFKSDVEKVELDLNEATYCFYPNRTIKQNKHQISKIECANYDLLVDNTTGFLSIFMQKSATELLKVMWPSAALPYIEGGIIPREKDNLLVEFKESQLRIKEDNDDYSLRREYMLKNDRIVIDTYLKMKVGAKEDTTKDTTKNTTKNRSSLAPISQLWVEEKLNQMMLLSEDAQRVLPEIALAPQNSHYEDFAFWNNALHSDDGFKPKRAQLKSNKSKIDVIFDERSTAVVHIPNMVFYLSYDPSCHLEEQHIEKLEICLNTEESEDA